jgi:O-antigen/teichoic acid export membrane protein
MLITLSDPAPLDIKFSQRLSTNVLSNLAYFIVSAVVGMALVPYFVNTLGLAAYGLIPLATSITGYVTLIIDSLNTSISRFLTIDLQRSDIRRANQTFNTALFGALAIILALVPIILLIAWFAPKFFDVGEAASGDVFILFSLILGSVLIRAWTSNFMVTLFAYNRLDYRNLVNITNLATQVILIVILFTVFSPSLVYVGISYFAAALISLCLAYNLSRKVCPYLHISVSSYSQTRFGEIRGIAFWVIIDTIGFMLNANIALLVVNRLFGGVAGSEYSLVILWSMLLYGISGLVTTAMTPMIFNYYSRQDTAGLIKFALFAMKCIGLFMAPIIGLICLFSPQLFTVWMRSDEFNHLAPLMWIVVSPVIVKVQTSAIGSISVGYGKVKIPALLTLFTGILNVYLSFTLPFMFGLGIYGVAISGAISMILHTGINVPLYTAYLVHAPLFTFLRAILKGIGYLAGFVLVGIVIRTVFPVSSISMSIVVGFGLLLGYAALVLVCVLSKNEKELLRSCSPLIISRHIPSWIL